MSRTIRLSGLFTLQSPLSHIGESISTCSYLVQEPVLQPDHTIEEIFCYSGNAWRGQLRDLCAGYMLDKLGGARVPIDTFHLLFSGGKIGGDQVVDIEKARAMRRAVPMLSLFGGGMGNQIMPGKLRVSNCYPVCDEARRLLPKPLREAAEGLSYRGLTFEKSFTRMDDLKNEHLLPHLAETDLLLLESGKAKKTDEVSTQMRMTCELVIASTQLFTEIEALDVTDIELGCLVSALHRFAVSPHIGGQGNRGHGRVALHYELADMGTGETVDFLRVGHGLAKLAPPAEDAKQAYDVFLRQTYDAMLSNQQAEITKMLGAA
jgi:hypothetical protein